jgi:hypothetical protein
MRLQQYHGVAGMAAGRSGKLLREWEIEFVGSCEREIPISFTTEARREGEQTSGREWWKAWHCVEVGRGGVGGSKSELGTSKRVIRTRVVGNQRGQANDLWGVPVSSDRTDFRLQ